MPHRAKSQTLSITSLLLKVLQITGLVQSTNLLLQGILKAMSLQTEQNLGNLNKMENRQEMENSMEDSSQMLEQSESESESPKAPSLFVVHEAFRCGGPFGVFSGTCACILRQFATPVKILVVLPEQGHLAVKLKKDLKDHAVKKGLPWYDLNIDELLTYVSSVLEEDLEEQKCAHYASMDVKD